MTLVCCGWQHATAPAPGGGLEELAVVIITARGVTAQSPRVLITANIHGPEVCPCIVAHRLIEHCEAAMEAGTLRGTVVVYPSLNPTGHRALSRHPQFENALESDPNRAWPDFNPFKRTAANKLLEGDALKRFYDLEVTNTTPIEKCWAALFDVWRPAGFAIHLDLHTMGNHLCNPFAYLHPTLYSENDPSFTKEDADVLAAKMKELHGAIGLSILVEPPASTYIKNNTHRTTVGAVLNGLHIPSSTLELGPHSVVDPAARDAGLQGCKNALVLAGCLPGEPIKPLDGIVRANVNLDNLHRVLSNYPRAPCAGIVDYQVPAGTPFKRGDLLAIMRGMDGQRRAEVRAEIDGFVVAWGTGVDKHEGQSLGMVGTPVGDQGKPVTWEAATGKNVALAARL